MARPKRKTSMTSVKMTPEMMRLWDAVANAEHRSRTNMLEVLVMERAKTLGLSIENQSVTTPKDTSHE